jgi:hypothetical protein
MTMKLSEFKQLKKLMMMTMSGAPAEVDFALKRANELLAKHGLDWDRVLNKTVTVAHEFEEADEPADPADRRAAEAREVDEAFSAVEASDPRGSFADFISDLKTRWESTRHLSMPQKDALFKAARRAQDGGRR